MSDLPIWPGYHLAHVDVSHQDIIPSSRTQFFGLAGASIATHVGGSRGNECAHAIHMIWFSVATLAIMVTGHIVLMIEGE
jgi:hypothetical protein